MPVSTRSLPTADKVECRWSPAVSNGFDVTGYRVQIQGADDTYKNVVAACEENIIAQPQQNFDAFGRPINNFSPVAMTGTVCTLSEAYLRSADLMLPELALVNCRVTAINQMGESDFCQGTGAKMPLLVKPPDAPSIQFVSRGCSQLTVQCLDGANNGGEAPSEYSFTYYQSSLNSPQS
jgi:hypothetical protein